MTISKNKTLKARDFDASFEDDDITKYLDIKSAKARYPVQRVSIDFPKVILENLDTEAAKIGVTRTSLIKMWVAQQLSRQHTRP